MEKFITGVVLTIGFTVLVVALGLLFAWPVMWLVNFIFAPAIILAVFGTVKLSFWKAYALLVLCGLLFKSSSSK